MRYVPIWHHFQDIIAYFPKFKKVSLLRPRPLQREFFILWLIHHINETKLTSVCLWYISHRYKTANIKIFSENSKHRS